MKTDHLILYFIKNLVGLNIPFQKIWYFVLYVDILQSPRDFVLIVHFLMEVLIVGGSKQNHI